jgi:endonuclease/exonuclease/phosphatase family metal-dependent hydrolase
MGGSGLRVLSWNVQGEIGISDQRMQEQLEFLDTQLLDTDLLLFQAVNYERRDDGDWGGQLDTLTEFLMEHSYSIVHTGDWAEELATSSVQPHANIEGAHNRCNLIASRWPIERRPLTLRNRGDRKPRGLNYYYSHFPEKLLVTEVDVSSSPSVECNTVELWNVGIINGANWGEEKLNMLETVYGRIYLQIEKTGVPVLLGGDFNAPKRERADGSITPHGSNKGQYTTYPGYGDPHYTRDPTGEMAERTFRHRWQAAETRIFDPDVGDWGMRDAYWAAEECPKAASEIDYTHVLSNGTPARKRLDHVLVSPEFEVETCELLNGELGSPGAFSVSDHAPVVTDLQID